MKPKKLWNRGVTTKSVDSSMDRKRITGQGMTEYIIIVALIALASITTVKLFGGAVQGAFGGMASVLGGGTEEAGAKVAEDNSKAIVDTESQKNRTLGDYSK